MSHPVSKKQAHAMGAKGGVATKFEQQLFEEWMRGHCWAVGPKLDTGEYYEMSTRIIWAGWRDAMALMRPALEAEQNKVKKLQDQIKKLKQAKKDVL